MPAGGSAAAAAVALAAALVEKVAKLSLRHWARAGETIGHATALRNSALELIDADAFAYTEFLVARRGAKDRDSDAQRIMSRAKAKTIDVPLAVIRTAAETVELAGALAESGNHNLRSDALVATTLAVAGAQAALITMQANLPAGSRDPRLVEARRVVRNLSAWVRSLRAPGRASARGRARA